MEIIKYPGREEWSSLIKRPALDVTTLFDTVRTVLDEVREGGDAAVIRYEEKFDKIDPSTFKGLQVSEQELAEAKELVPEELKQAIRQAKNNIEIFHASQRFTGKKVETTPGVSTTTVTFLAISSYYYKFISKSVLLAYQDSHGRRTWAKAQVLDR